VNFSRFQAVIHILTVNCAKIIQDRPGQPAYDMFGIKRRLQRRRPNVRQVQRVLRTSASNLGTPIENVRFLLLTINLAREWLQIDTDLLRVS